MFIGTQFSNLYTAVDTPARGRVGSLTHEHRFYKVGGADLIRSVDHTLHLVLVHLSVCFDLVLQAQEINPSQPPCARAITTGTPHVTPCNEHPCQRSRTHTHAHIIAAHSRTLFRTPLRTHLREAGFKGGETRPVGHPFARAFVPLDRALILGGRRRGTAAAGLSVGIIHTLSNERRTTQQRWMFAH